MLRVSDLERALAFYRDALGLAEVACYRGLVFLSGGERHHDLALIETRAIDCDAGQRLPCLHHLAFRIGNDLETLGPLRKRLQGTGIPILGTSDHRVSLSLYLCGPDGVLVEPLCRCRPRDLAGRPHRRRLHRTAGALSLQHHRLEDAGAFVTASEPQRIRSSRAQPTGLEDAPERSTTIPPPPERRDHGNDDPQVARP